jgi:hypothetical protein
LVKEKVVANKKKEKYLFGPSEYLRFITTFWKTDDISFVHPRNKVQVAFILSVFTWTGARIGAFFPNSDNKDYAGLRYKVCH